MSSTISSDAPSSYVKMNVGGTNFVTSIETLTGQDTMLKAMFGGQMKLQREADGSVLIDRSGKHFDRILNYLRDGTTALPESIIEIEELLLEAKFYCIQELAKVCEETLKEKTPKKINSVYFIDASENLQGIVETSSKLVIVFQSGRKLFEYHQSYKDNVLKNLHLFEKLISKYSEHVIFVKDLMQQVNYCHWFFYKCGEKKAQINGLNSTCYESVEAQVYEKLLELLL